MKRTCSIRVGSPPLKSGMDVPGTGHRIDAPLPTPYSARKRAPGYVILDFDGSPWPRPARSLSTKDPIATDTIAESLTAAIRPDFGQDRQFCEARNREGAVDRGERLRESSSSILPLVRSSTLIVYARAEIGLRRIGVLQSDSAAVCRRRCCARRSDDTDACHSQGVEGTDREPPKLARAR